MRLIYYKGLIAYESELTSTERILYSFLLNKSVNNEAFDTDGRYCEDTFDVFDEFDLPTFNQYDFAEKTKIVSQGSLSLAYRGLIDKGIIDVNRGIIKHNDIARKGYFVLCVESKLKGELLIFYSWLKNLSKGCPIVATMQRLGTMYNVSMNVIRDYLHRLSGKGLIERDNKGNLIIK